MKVISFLSDFGLSDSYVGEVKAVLSAVRGATIVDLTHLVPAHQVEWGAFQLLRAYRHFPKGTWHLAVVDPGVGTDRRAIYVRTKDYHFVGPDNGLLRWAVEDAERCERKKAQVFEIEIPQEAAATFHGRDVFAPFIVDKNKAKGKAKPSKKPLAGRMFPHARKEGRNWVGEILAGDRYGNLISSIPWTPEDAVGEIRGRVLHTVGSYAAIPPSEAALIRGSSGFWEVSCREASAAQRLGVQPGATLLVSDS